MFIILRPCFLFIVCLLRRQRRLEAIWDRGSSPYRHTHNDPMVFVKAVGIARSRYREWLPSSSQNQKCQPHDPHASHTKVLLVAVHAQTKDKSHEVLPQACWAVVPCGVSGAEALHENGGQLLGVQDMHEVKVASPMASVPFSSTPSTKRNGPVSVRMCRVCLCPTELSWELVGCMSSTRCAEFALSIHVMCPYAAEQQLWSVQRRMLVSKRRLSDLRDISRICGYSSSHAVTEATASTMEGTTRTCCSQRVPSGQRKKDTQSHKLG